MLAGRERLYYSWPPQLAIVMHIRDRPLLEAVRQTMECGTVYEHKSTVSLRVYAIAEHDLGGMPHQDEKGFALSWLP